MLGTHCSLTSRCLTSAAGLYLTVSHKRDINIYICCTMGGLSNKATVCGTAAVGLRGGGAGRSVGLGGVLEGGERSWKGKGRSGAWGGSWRWGRGPGRGVGEIVQRESGCGGAESLGVGKRSRGWGRDLGGGGDVLEMGGELLEGVGERCWGGTRPYRGELLGAVGAAGLRGGAAL